MSFATILVPIDYEAAANVALRIAGGLARSGKSRLLVMYASPLPSCMLGSTDFGPHLGHCSRTKVNAAMTPDPVTITAAVDAKTAARVMLERRVRALPVVDGEKVIGIISASDVLEEDYARAARS